SIAALKKYQKIFERGSPIGSCDFFRKPYSMAGGLHDGGAAGSDFTVVGVDRSGCMGNFFKGQLAGLAVYRRAFTPAEMYAVSSMDACRNSVSD
ncbi:MAG: hypothetical protein CML13_02795, partial [Puniceicoccaceae bacterium]|nr:hypothetical protein [Puniceicoccaceae bacterium]